MRIYSYGSFQLRDDPMTQCLKLRSMQNTVNPENFQASPKGWTDGYRKQGNNVEVKSEGGTPFETTTRGMFNGVFDPTSPPQTLKNLVAGAINAFYDAVGEKNPYRIGEIWAAMLLEVYWNLVEKYGFSANLHDATQEKGNIIFLQLFVGTLMIQPCDPTFDSARDAMLAADDAYYGGIHKHLIIKGFAKRGLVLYHN
ncbi:hypothetical protein BASA62_002837 [Batrachochytrium salamandrivorans]|nr:hypothetical protein BASA62_002837 [Batrachochytrium salamandrivorans]